MSEAERIAGSFRDPSGHVFRRDGIVYRQINPRYSSDFDALIASGLYDELTADRLLIAHEEIAASPSENGGIRILRPEQLPFISYPYEWCFEQLRDAALLTLEIQRRALHRGMMLKDASAFNVQFLGSRPVFIDVLSFERYQDGKPWPAYLQFCRHFLNPLALMSYVDPSLGMLGQAFLDGPPSALVSRLLPKRTRFRPGLVMHVHLPAVTERQVIKGVQFKASAMVSRCSLLGIIENLSALVGSLRTPRGTTVWEGYYTSFNYSAAAFETKERIVNQWAHEASANVIWDLGANTGLLSRNLSKFASLVVAYDFDRGAVEANYRECKKSHNERVLPLCQDLTNPSPALGWRGRERDSLASRGPADLALALALVHHLAIANNVPLSEVAAFLAELGRQLIVEFVPKEDSQVQRMLRTRDDIFSDYGEKQFVLALEKHFLVQDRVLLPDSVRSLYRLVRRDGATNRHA